MLFNGRRFGWIILAFILGVSAIACASVAHQHSSSPQILAGLHGNKVAISPDSKLLAVGDYQGIITLWDIHTHRVVRKINTGIISIRAMAFSADNHTLASSSLGLGYATGPPGQTYDSTVHIWDAGTGKLAQILTGHTGVIASLAFTQDGQILISGSDDGTVKLWRKHHSAWRVLHSLTYGKGASVYAVSVGAETLAVGGTHGVQLWDLRTKHLLKQPTGYWGSIYAVALSPDGRHLAASGQDPTLRLWDVKTWSLQRAAVPKAGTVCFLSFSPDGKILVSGSGVGSYLWKTNPLTVERQLNKTSYQEQGPLIAFSPDGKDLVTNASMSPSEQSTIQKWSIQ
jgi:WD40 repeat protein